MTAAAVPDTPVLRLRGNFAWTSVGWGVYAVCQWAIVAVLAKLGSPTLVGQYALGLAITTPVLTLAQMNLRSVLATDVRDEHPFVDYRNLRILSLVLAIPVIAVIALVQGGDKSRLLLILLIGVAQMVEGVSDIYYGLMQRRGLMDRMAISLVARGLLGVVALGLGVYFGSLAYGLLCLLIARTLVFVFFDGSYGIRDLATPVSRRCSNEAYAHQRALFVQALPLGIVLMLVALVNNVPRYFIAQHLGEWELGIFSAVFSMTQGGTLLVNSLGQASTPQLARLYAHGDRPGFSRLSWRMMIFGGILGLAAVAGAIAAGPFLLRLLYRPEYARYGELLTASMGVAGIGFIGSLLGYSITAARRFREQMPLQALGLAATAAVAFVAVPRLGLMGGVLSIGAGALAQVVGSVCVLRGVLAGMSGPSPERPRA